MKTIVTTVYTSDDGKTRYRIVELRPGVFSVEEHKKDWLFRYWAAVKHNRFAVSEYSPQDVSEFTFDGALAYIKRVLDVVDLENAREKPPEGYPKVM